MRLLDRYLLREFLVPLAFCLGGFLILWMAFDLFAELGSMQSKQLEAGDIARYYLFRAPDFLVLVLPIALLLALLYTLTNHTRHNEITAIRAAGVSLWRLSLPYLAVGAAASVTLFVVNEYCVPPALETAENILNQRRRTVAERQEVRDLVFVNAREARHWKAGVYNKVTAEMTSPEVNWRLPDGRWRKLVADRAMYTNSTWVFIEAHPYQQPTPTNSLRPLPRVAVLAMPEFTETPDLIKSAIFVNERYGRATTTRTRKADVPLSEIVNYLRLHPNPERGLRAWLYTKLHGRFAAACICLVVVLLAVPFATASGRRNVFVGVAGSIVIFFVYYVLQQVGLTYGEAGRAPPWLAAWFPILLFGVASMWMMARVR